MKYIDSIHDEGANLLSEIKSYGEMLRLCNSLFDEYERQYDKIRDAYTRSESCWHVWDCMTILQQVPTVRTLMDSEEIWREFLNVCSEYILLCMEATTACKYLLQTETDWGYQYFVRKIYLLMHETQPLLGRQKEIINKLRTILNEVEFEAFAAARKRFFVYIQKYDKSDFDFVCDKIEAHRDKVSIDDQI